MCGRFTIISSQEIIEARFRARFTTTAKPSPRYNAAPEQKLPVILNTNPEEIEMMSWGLKPVWLKAMKGRSSLINVKAETLRDKTTFKSNLEKRRCLIIADGFYEWKQETGSKKVPYRFILKDEKPFAFAGIWEEHKNGDRAFAIITTEPNEIVSPIHNRMPVILNPHTEESWIDNALSGKILLDLLKPYPANLMRAYSVSTDVNRIQNDNPVLIYKHE